MSTTSPKAAACQACGKPPGNVECQLVLDELTGLRGLAAALARDLERGQALAGDTAVPAAAKIRRMAQKLARLSDRMFPLLSR
jgi:hypothetical protein